VLAKEPLHLTPEQIRWLAVAPILFLVLGAFTAGSISDRLSRTTVMQIGVISSTFLTLLIPLTQTGIANKKILTREVNACQDHPNEHHAKANWQFKTADARVKPKRLYPQFE
jgi:MFS family permease